ncbi:MAG: ATP-binding protein, partial [Pseudomonadota bacterium]
CSAGARMRPGIERGPMLLKHSALVKTKLAQRVIDSGRVQAVDSTPPVFESMERGFSVPLVAGGELYGMLDTGYPAGADLSAEDEPLIIPIANHLSVALRNVRLHAESALLRDYLAMLIEHAGALIVCTDGNWMATVFNQAVARLTGIDRGELVGRDIRQWLSSSEQLRPLAEEIAQVLSGNKARTVDVEMPSEHGKVVRTVWTVAGIGQGSTVEAVVAVGHDQTLIKSLERQVVQAEKLATLGQLAAGIAHEVNNPLTSIVAYADFLLKKLQRQEPLEAGDAERLRRILEGAERIFSFTRDLVQYAKPAGSSLTRLSLNDVVRQAVSFCEHLLKRCEAQFSFELADGLKPIMAVRSQLQQVVVNLITNAVQALPQADGCICVRTLATDDLHVALVVEDDGSGIPASYRDRIFEPFFSTKADGKGTGLGLSIVKSIVEHHRGTVAVSSELGKGTAITVVLPAC